MGCLGRERCVTWVVRESGENLARNGAGFDGASGTACSMNCGLAADAKPHLNDVIVDLLMLVYRRLGRSNPATGIALQITATAPFFPNQGSDSPKGAEQPASYRAQFINMYLQRKRS